MYNYNIFVYGQKQTDSDLKKKERALNKFNTPFIDIAMHKVQMHAGAIRKLLYGLCVCMGDNPRAKARGLSFRTDAQTIQ